MQLLVLAYNDVEFKDFKICNCFLERYLDENISEMVSSVEDLSFLRLILVNMILNVLDIW